MPTLSEVSRRNLKGVNPKLVQLVELAIVATPVDFRVTDGLRSLNDQRYLVSIGASQTLDSRHLTGDAIDLVPWIEGKPKWHWPLIYPMADHIRKCAKELDISIRWGGCWDLAQSFTYTVKPSEELSLAYVERMRSQGKKPFLDGVHFELCGKVK